MKTHLIFRFLAPLLLCSSAEAANHNWSGLGASENWSSVANWSSGGAPIANASGASTLVFPSGGFRPTNICNVADLTLESIILNGSGYDLIGSLPITLTGVGNSLYSAGTNNYISIPLVLDSANLNFGQGNGASLRVFSVISGPGGFKKIGRGDLYFEGSSDNTYAGTTTVLGGTLHLKKQSSRICISGPLVIGDTAGSSVGGGVDSTVLMEGAQQMAFSTAVTVNPDGELDMGSHSAAIGSLAMVGNGMVGSSGTAATLTVFGNITSTKPPNPTTFASIRPNLSLGGTTRTITTDNALSIYGSISSGGGNAGIIKNGAETLYLTFGNHTYTGDTIINQGSFSIYGSSPGSNIYMKPGTRIDGAATVGAVQCIGTVLEPLIYNTSGKPPANLTTKNLSLDKASTFVAFIDDNMVGTQSLLTVLGTVNLGDCKLDPELEVSATYNPPLNTKFLLVNNDLADPVIGNFNGLEEGASFKFSGRRWAITYKGGDGNDVVLTVASGQLPLSLDKITLGDAGNATILTGNGTPGEFTYRMESSPDLKVWTDEGSIGNSNGNLIAYAGHFPSHKKYFYRFLKPATTPVPN